MSTKKKNSKQRFSQFDDIIEEPIETKSPKKKKNDSNNEDSYYTDYMYEISQKETAYNKKKSSKSRDKERYDHWDKWN